MKAHAAVLALIAFAISVPSHAFKLISEEEAKQPDAVSLTNRGITRGPGIKLRSPDPSAGVVKAPFNLKVEFEPHGGSKIDMASVKVTYLKAKSVDLLERVKPGLTAGGIDLTGAEAPAGSHHIQISLQDSAGRKSSTVINLKVAK